MSSGSACWILWLTPMDWLALSIGRSGSQLLEYSKKFIRATNKIHIEDNKKHIKINFSLFFFIRILSLKSNLILSLY